MYSFLKIEISAAAASAILLELRELLQQSSVEELAA